MGLNVKLYYIVYIYIMDTQPIVTDKILNPKTNRMVKITSKLGQSILKENYIEVIEPTKQEEEFIISVSSDINDLSKEPIFEPVDIEIKKEKKKRIRYRKEYMKAYYEKNSDTIKERVRSKYIPKSKINLVIE